MSFNTLILIIVITIVVFLLLMPKKNNSSLKNKKEPEIWPFEKKLLMSIPEQKLYWRLVNLFPDKIVLAQVQASRVLKIRKGNDVQYWFNRICRTSYDFVICEKNSFPIAVIELDDSSHETVKRQNDDKRKDKALDSAKLKIIRLPIKQIINDNDLRHLVLTNKK